MSVLRTEIEAIEHEQKALRAQVSQLASMANKRLDRLEENELTLSPAYQKWEQNGSHRFSVGGKSYSEVQSEYWRVKDFLEMRTSSVTGTKAVLQEIATNIGWGEIDFDNIASTQEQISNFFRIADTVSQYLESVDESAAALDYQEIWDTINAAYQQGKIDFDNAELDAEQMQEIVSEMLVLEGTQDMLEMFDDVLDDVIGDVIGEFMPF